MVSETYEAIPRLSSWLKQYGWDVLQDKENDNDNPVFHVTGESTKKPDLIGISLKGNTLAMEVKSGDSGYDLGKNSKIIDYFINYNDNRTFYYNDNKQLIIINNFVVATNFSPCGRLGSVEPLHMEKKDSNRKWLYENGFEPNKEYEMTFNILRRGIWDDIKQYHDKYRNKKTGIGALLSSYLDDGTNLPAIFVKKPGPQAWCHRWYKNL